MHANGMVRSYYFNNVTVTVVSYFPVLDSYDGSKLNESHGTLFSGEKEFLLASNALSIVFWINGL